MNSLSDEDFARALHDRSALMKLFRELDQQEEAERQKEEDRETGDTLPYDSYLAHQSYYDDYKHVNYRFIDFGSITKRPLVIEQDRTLGKGGFVWDAGFILAEHFINNKEWHCDKSKSVIELGAGTGVAGLMIASTMPHVHVHLTDLPHVMPILNKNIAGTPNVSASALSWGEPVSKKYDVILGADCVASIYDSTALAETIFNLAHDSTRIYLSGKDRLDENIQSFVSTMKRLFVHVERIRPNSRNKNPNVWILVVEGKRVMQ